MQILIIIRKGYKSNICFAKYTFDQDDSLVHCPRILHTILDRDIYRHCIC